MRPCNERGRRVANAQAASAAIPESVIRPVRSYWVVPVSRAVVALVAAAFITFNRDHSAEFGLLVFGLFAIVNGVLTAVLSHRTLLDQRDRSAFLISGALGVLAGSLALAFQTGGLGFLLYLVSVWAAITGFLELYSGIRVRGRSLLAKDWMVVGTATAVLALLFLLLPPNTVVSVGLLGAYLVLIGVYLVIGGLSLKWSAPTDTDAP
jgi:uncharacterized membrane protein HdeD (DUF308 family)